MGVCFNVFMDKHDTIIKQTQCWIEKVIIHYSICPFAKREFEKNNIHYEVIDTDDMQNQLEQLIIQCESLDQDPNRETSLLIFPNGLSDFDRYLDLLEISIELLDKQGYEGIYQLASFHPQYRFEGSAIDDPSNYTNRSPYPMLHILREASVEQRLEHYPKPENIPDNNIHLTTELGIKKMKQLLADCFKL